MSEVINVEGALIEPIGQTGDGGPFDSGVTYYRISKYDDDHQEVFENENQVKEWLNEHMPPRACDCEHDCCGCRLVNGAYLIGYDPITEHYIIAENWAFNI